MPHNPLEGERPELSIDLHEGSEEQVSIVVIHKDRPEYLNLTIQSIAVSSSNNNYELIVSDNGSTSKDALDYLEDIEKQGIKVVRNAKNVYWSEAANKGAQAANKSSKYIVFMHHDVVVTNQAWLDLLINVSESQDSGMVGVELHSYYMQKQKVDFVQEWLLLMTRECWEEAGPWPERLPQIGPSFILTMAAQNKGYKPQVMRNPIAHHYRIFSLDINEYERLTEQAMVVIPQLMREKMSDDVKK